MMNSAIINGLLINAAVVLTVCMSILAGAANGQEAAWQGELKQQLMAEKNCELNYLTDIKSFELLGKMTVEVRAHCQDKRAFDATRSGDMKQFELRSCEVVTC